MRKKKMACYLFFFRPFWVKESRHFYETFQTKSATSVVERVL